MKIKISSSKLSGGLSKPVYDVSSPLELLDRLMRCRSVTRITEISVRVGVRENWYTLAWVVAGGEAITKINRDRLTDPEYLEELAVRCFERAINLGG